MKPHHFSAHRAATTDGPDDPRHLEPTDLSKVKPEDLHLHEGEPVMLTVELLDWFTVNGLPNTTDGCTFVEESLDLHYNLAGTGYGIAWDTRDNTARLVKL